MYISCSKGLHAPGTGAHQTMDIRRVMVLFKLLYLSSSFHQINLEAVFPEEEYKKV